jgi:hypothetical protein
MTDNPMADLLPVRLEPSDAASSEFARVAVDPS